MFEKIMHFYMHYVFAKDKNIFLGKSETSILVECNIFKFVRGLKNTYRIMFVNFPFTNGPQPDPNPTLFTTFYFSREIKAAISYHKIDANICKAMLTMNV